MPKEIDFKSKDHKSLILFSGGADSTALLEMMYQQGVGFTALHFNHHLRSEESDADEQWCRDFCEQREIDFLSVDLYVREAMQSDETEESAARRMRLDYLRLHYLDYYIYLAHHADDVDETFVMRVLRGAGASGLCSLRKERDLGGLTLIRPLLDWNRKDLHKYLKEKSLSWREDSSNQDASYCLRNRIRLEVLPQLKELGTGLRNTQKLLAQAADYLESEAQRHFDEKGFTREMFLNLHAALKQRVLRLWFEDNGDYSVPSSAAVERLESEWSKLPERAAEIPLGQDVYVTLWADGKATFGKENYLRWLPVSWCLQDQKVISVGGFVFSIEPLKNSLGSETFKYKSLVGELLIQPYTQGSRLVPFGRKSPKKISDLLSSENIEISKRSHWPLLSIGEQVIWVPGVRRAEFGRTSEGDKSVTIYYAKL